MSFEIAQEYRFDLKHQISKKSITQNQLIIIFFAKKTAFILTKTERFLLNKRFPKQYE